MRTQAEPHTVVPPGHWQTPPWHEPPLSDVQAEPFAIWGLLQRPLLGLHMPTEWQSSCALQVTDVVPPHTPDELHLSEPVHALLSLQLAPVLGTGAGQPSDGSHVPTFMHGSDGCV